MTIYRTMILGASGYVGGELCRLLARHPALEASILVGQGDVGRTLGEVHPHLAAHGASVIEPYDPSRLGDVDLVLAALPHGATQDLARAILDADVAFVDLGADFRLDDASDFERWYGEAHRAPDLLDRFVYGIPELGRAAIRESKAVAAAGCYATAAILTLAPLVRAGLLEPGSLTVDGLSGVSGAGKSPSATTHFDHVHGSARAYGLLSHRHTAEMQMALGQELLFTPHLVPMDRGILVTCHAMAATTGDPFDVLRAAYADEPFIHVTEEPPSTKAVMGSNMTHVTARRCERTGRILALGAIDNLVKGAAGQMIQCANLVLGLDEATGLPREGMWP